MSTVFSFAKLGNGRGRSPRETHRLHPDTLKPVAAHPIARRNPRKLFLRPHFCATCATALQRLDLRVAQE